MIKVVSTEGQNIFDIALQAYGSVEGVFELMADNEAVSSINDQLPIGTELQIVSKPVDKAIASFFSKKQRRVNTGEVPFPSAPTGLIATQEGIGGIRLNWQDNSLGEVRFTVYRKLTGNLDFTKLIELPPNTTTFLDTALNDETSYTYIVTVSDVVESESSNEATAITRDYDLLLIFTANEITADFASSISQDVAWRLTAGAYQLNTHTIGTPLNISDTGGGIVRFYFDNSSAITGISTDSNAQLIGQVVIDGRFTSLLNYTGQNGLYEFIPANWVQKGNVSIDVTNSIVTLDRTVALVDAVILANGGTVTDDGEDYTGTPGLTYASRSLTIGTIELDLVEPENAILYQKIIALQSVGWTISTVTTVCTKAFDVNTSTLVSVAVELERTREMVGIEYVAGTPMSIDLYDTLANAEAAGATGRLAQGYPLVDAWLRNNTNYNAWTPGTMKAMRFYAADNVGTGNQSIVSYKAAPTAERACGAVTKVQSPLVGNSKDYDGSFNEDRIASWAAFERTQPFTMFFALERDTANTFDGVFSSSNAANTSNGRGLHVSFRDNGALQINISNNSNPLLAPYNDLVVVTDTIFPAGRYIGAVCYDGLSNDTSFTIVVGGVTENYTLSRPNTLTGTILNGLNTAVIGRISVFTSDSYFDGLIRILQILDTDYSQSPTLQAILDNAIARGSFEGLVDDARFLLDVDFNKTGTENLTTRAGTPTYAITAIGGSAYTPY